MPIATNENIVTERTTDGASPAKIPNKDNETRITINFINEPFLVLGIGFSTKVMKINIKPMCKPETDKICMAPAY